MPFRSEEVVLRERIRRAEEDAAALLEKQEAMRSELAARSRKRATWLLLSIGITAATLVGWGGGSLAAATHDKAVRAAQLAEEAGELGREHAQVVECQGGEARASAELLACQRGLAEKQRAAARSASQPAQCSCRQGDPLCQCAFDPAIASSALTAAQTTIRGCFVPARPVAFHTKVTFAAGTGQVESAVIDSSDGNLTESDRSCVLAVLRRVKVPSFGGAAVTVGRSYTVRSP
ncbi:MAG: hypothetical protein JWP97_40 [Labilithrix sp.]|nr:hypothetical protein [Labilithrix sp.]